MLYNLKRKETRYKGEMMEGDAEARGGVSGERHNVIHSRVEVADRNGIFVASVRLMNDKVKQHEHGK